MRANLENSAVAKDWKRSVFIPIPKKGNAKECSNHHTIALISAAAIAAKSLQSCPTLCDPIDCSPPGSPVPGILQARTLEWVAISFSWHMVVHGVTKNWTGLTFSHWTKNLKCSSLPPGHFQSCPHYPGHCDHFSAPLTLSLFISGPLHLLFILPGPPSPHSHMISEKWKWSCSVLSDCLQSHWLQPTWLLHPLDFPGKNTGVGCHFLLSCIGRQILYHWPGKPLSIGRKP